MAGGGAGRKKRGRGAGERKEVKRGGVKHPVELRGTGEKGGGCFATQKSRMTQRGYIYVRGKGGGVGGRSQKQRMKLGNNREEVLK